MLRNWSWKGDAQRYQSDLSPLRADNRIGYGGAGLDFERDLMHVTQRPGISGILHLASFLRLWSADSCLCQAYTIKRERD